MISGAQMGLRLRQIIDDPDLARQMGEASRQIACLHAVERTLAAHESLYAEIVNRRR